MTEDMAVMDVMIEAMVEIETIDVEATAETDMRHPGTMTEVQADMTGTKGQGTMIDLDMRGLLGTTETTTVLQGMIDHLVTDRMC